MDYFLLIFGIFWTGFCLPEMASMWPDMISLWETQPGSSLMIAVASLVFLGVGFGMIGYALYDIIKNKLTDIKGEVCAAKVQAIYDTNIEVNESPIFAVRLLVYVESEGVTREYKEKIGSSSYLYTEGELLLVKVYGKDVNIEGKLDSTKVPQYILDKLRYNDGFGPVVNKKVGTENLEDEILVGGVLYKKVDDEEDGF